MTQDQALNILKTGANVFLTGEPGSGKTHTINAYVAYLRTHGIEPAITASTGIAATHIGGQTIHSWSGIGIKGFLSAYDLDNIASSEKYGARIDAAHVLIIDEISMLSAETLSMVDAVCKEVKRSELPFGGLQIILVGDFFQLPPISKNLGSGDTTPFAFNSPAWANANLVVCYLTEQHRHNDAAFTGILTAIRRNTFNEDHLAVIQERIVERAQISQKIPRLFTHNMDVDQLNSDTLEKLPGVAREFTMTHKGRANLIEALKKGCLSPEKLYLKPGAIVIFTKNSPRFGFVNGTLGTVEGFTDENQPIVRTKDGQKIIVQPMDWSMEEGGQIKATISQFPLRLAWALTVHKSQGLSMDAAAMDLARVFEYGQGYVALSRLRTLNGLHLFGFNAQAFQVHPDILNIDEDFRQSSDNNEAALGNMDPLDLRKNQESFLINNGGQLKEVPRQVSDIQIKDKTDTRDQTLALWNQGMTLEQICDERRLKLGTILTHIEELIDSKKLDGEVITKILSPALKKRLPEIKAAFKKTGDDKLTPVFQALKGEFSYDDLNLARLAIKHQTP